MAILFHHTILATLAILEHDAVMLSTLASLPPKQSPGLVGPDGDIYYAVFVGVVLVALLAFSVLVYMKTSKE